MQRYGWDRAAPYYDACWREALGPAADAVLRLAAVQAGERVLDVACGTGTLAFAAAAATGPAGEVIGTDISEKMVAAARAGAAGRSLGQCAFERVDAEETAPAGGFDTVLCGLGLMYVANPERALERMAAALVPGGRVVVSVWGRREACAWAAVFPIVQARVDTDVCPLFFRLGAKSALAAALRGTGLEEVVTERIPTVLCYASGQQACDAALLGGPVALAYSRFDEPTRAQVCADYLAALEPYRAGGGYRVPAEFVVGRGVRRR